MQPWLFDYEGYMSRKRQELFAGFLLFILYAFNTLEMFILSPERRVINACRGKDETVYHGKS